MKSKIQFEVFLIFCVCTSVFGASVRVLDKNATNVDCQEVPKMLLVETLGSAFNARYMSISPPPADQDPDEGKYKRTSGNVPPFYAMEKFAHVIDDTPAWPGTTEVVQKRKRALGSEFQWKCESRLHWIDLGRDYFPRYLRSVECTTKTCWYNMFKCTPKFFTVKLLRRRKDRCVIAKAESAFNMKGLPVDLRELWVWEERALNFCCDCAIG